RCLPPMLRLAVVTHRAGPAGPRNGSQRLARLEFCAGSGRRKGWGLRDVRGVPLPCVTTVSTTSNLGLPRSVTSLGQSTSTLVLEGLLHRMIVQRRCAFFLEQSLLFPRRCNAPLQPLVSPRGERKR